MYTQPSSLVHPKRCNLSCPLAEQRGTSLNDGVFLLAFSANSLQDLTSFRSSGRNSGHLSHLIPWGLSRMTASRCPKGIARKVVLTSAVSLKGNEVIV